MALEIFKLVGSIFVDADEANKSIQKTDKNAQSVGSTLASGIGTAAKWTAGLVAGAATVATGLTALATDAASTTDNIDKMSQRLGLSRESFQELDFALSQSGVDINSFQTGMKSLLANMDKVNEGNKTAIANFDMLGVSVQNADGSLRSEEDVLFDTIAAFQEMENSSEKTRLAQELFGKQGQEIVPLLNSEAGSIENMRQQAHDLGLILSDELIDSGVELTDSLDQTKRAFESIVTQLSGSLMPIVISVSDMLQEALPTIQSLISSIAPIISDLFDGLIPPLMELGKQIFPIVIDLINMLLPVVTEIVSAILPIIVELIQILIPPLMEIIQAILPVFVTLLDALMPIIETVMELLSPILELVLALIVPLIQLIAELLPPLINFLAELIGKILEPAIPIIKNVATAIKNYLSYAFEKLEPVIQNVKGIFQGFLDFITGVFTGDWKKAWNGIVSIFTNIWEGIKTSSKETINGMITLLNKAFSSIGNISIPDWVPIVGGKTFSLPQIPMLAEGGVVSKSGSAIVGEAGAELVNLPVGASVTPLNGTEHLIDYDKLAAAIVKAIRTCAPDLKNNVILNADADGLFNMFVTKASERSYAGMEVY